MSNLILFGATGATGKLVLSAALTAGHTVTAFVRDPNRLHATPSRVVTGDVTDAVAVAAAIDGHDAVICSLGAPARSAARVREVGTRHIVAGMHAARVHRLVVQSTYGLGGTWPSLPFFVRQVVVPFHLQRGFADHVEQEFIVRGSGLDWTILRPPFLVDGPGTGEVRTHDLEIGPAPRWKIARADVARLLVARAADGGWSHEAVPVTW